MPDTKDEQLYICSISLSRRIFRSLLQLRSILSRSFYQANRLPVNLYFSSQPANKPKHFGKKSIEARILQQHQKKSTLNPSTPKAVKASGRRIIQILRPESSAICTTGISSREHQLSVCAGSYASISILPISATPSRVVLPPSSLKERAL